MAKLTAVVAALLAFLFSFNPVFAVTINITSYPSTITDEPFSLTVQISGAQANSTNYLRIDLYQSGSTNYFGYTYNGTDFYSGSDYTQYPQVTIAADGTATKTIEGKVDTASSSYKGSGSYMIRVRRYTASGGYSAQDANAGAVSTTINIVAPSPSPTPTPSPSPTPSPQKSPSPLPQSSTTISTIKPSPKPQAVDPPDPVLGESSKSATPSASPSPSPSQKPKSLLDKIKDDSKTALILVGSGLVIVGLSSAFYVWYSKLLGKGQTEEKDAKGAERSQSEED